MLVGITSEGERTVVENDGPLTVAEVLQRVGIAASTVLAVVGGVIIPHTSTIEGDVEIELIIVSSGG
jgi:sulfur carrier protein ThiS